MKTRFLCLCVALMILFAGCGGSKDAIPSNSDRANELGQEFIDDLSYVYIPLRDKPQDLMKRQVVVSEQGASYNVGLIQQFAESQNTGENCMVTIAFTSSATVFTRLVYEDGIGYYLRYQYSEQEEGKALEVGNRYFTGTKFESNDTATTATLSLLAGKNEIIQLTFKNIAAGTDSSSDQE